MRPARRSFAKRRGAFAPPSVLRRFVLAAALLLATRVFAALPVVTEFRSTPEKVTDAELSALLDSRVKSADVVAIGETVHGSSDLLRVQARLLRWLVERHGFRLLVWENPVLRSLELARWVASCTTAKTPAPVDVLYFPTTSDLAWLDWLCDFNRTHPNDPVVFRGMDVWDRTWEHYARIRALAQNAGIDRTLLSHVERCPAYRASSWGAVDAVLSDVQSSGSFAPETDYERCRTVLTTVLQRATQTAAEKRQKKDAGADDAYELALSASTLLGWLGFYRYNWSDDILSWNARDRAQGRNIALLMEKHGAARAIVTGHTSHVSHNRSAADWWGFGDIKSGVHFFAAMTTKKVFSVALTAYEASGAQGHFSVPVARNSVDKKLHDAGHAFSFFAADAPFLAEHRKWWLQNQSGPGPYESGVELVLADHFDAFFFVARSHLDRTLPARPVWQP